MLFKHILEKYFDAMTEEDRVRHFHHGCFKVQTKHNIIFFGIRDFPLIECAQVVDAHDRSVDNFSSLQLNIKYQQKAIVNNLVENDTKSVHD